MERISQISTLDGFHILLYDVERMPHCSMWNRFLIPDDLERMSHSSTWDGFPIPIDVDSLTHAERWQTDDMIERCLTAAMLRYRRTVFSELNRILNLESHELVTQKILLRHPDSDTKIHSFDFLPRTKHDKNASMTSIGHFTLL